MKDRMRPNPAGIYSRLAPDLRPSPISKLLYPHTPPDSCGTGGLVQQTSKDHHVAHDDSMLRC